MANRAEQRPAARISELNAGRRIDFPTSPEPSVPAALEKIASVSQRVLSKRIDLLMLDNHELISRLLVKAAALSVGVVTGLAAWLTAIAALVTYAVPWWSTSARLAAFAAINAVMGAIVVLVTLRDPPRLSGETEEEREDRAEAAGAAAAPVSRMSPTREGERSGG